MIALFNQFQVGLPSLLILLFSLDMHVVPNASNLGETRLEIKGMLQMRDYLCFVFTQALGSLFENTSKSEKD